MMRNACLFLLAFLVVAFVMVAVECGEKALDYQAYERPKVVVPE